MPSQNSDDKLDRALQLLIEAARENKIGFNQYVTHIFEKLKEKENEAAAKVKKTAVAVDQHVRDRPWIYLAAAAMSGLVIGFLLPRPRSRNCSK